MDKFLNVDYRIVIEVRCCGSRVSRGLVGRRGLKKFLGDVTYIRVVKMAYKRNLEKIICKPRKDTTITFYAK